MSWGGLNPALTAWRDAINEALPDRSRTSDGGYADPNHGSSSEHQPDPDGTVDAFDMDVNVLGSDHETGTLDERLIIEALKTDFERDPRGRGQLWIHQREIANRDVGNWREREYDGDNPHDKHVHWQSRQSHETNTTRWPLPHTEKILRDLRGDDMSAEDVISALETKRPYTLKRISERGWADLSIAGKVDYIFEALIAAGLIDADNDGQADDSASVPARLARIEGALARVERALPTTTQ